ncbi:MAG: ribosomal-processing cysteine protease Prp [Firmicutes bacterium]|nr:ribosomal-processing cysteine protease Prp [Bacillota bacterium]
MTKVTITKTNSHITAVSALGHTDYAVEGEDIVCAALSSIIQTALLGLLTVAGIGVDYKKDDEEGRLEFSLPALSEKDRYAADMILNTMAAGVNDLYEGFSKFVKVKTVSK